eukprot:1161671-Pelagomonas_calceolata.AAC.31
MLNTAAQTPLGSQNGAHQALQQWTIPVPRCLPQGCSPRRKVCKWLTMFRTQQQMQWCIQRCTSAQKASGEGGHTPAMLLYLPLKPCYTF